MTSLTLRFLQLFAGLQRSHGIYVVPQNATPTEKGKLHNTSWARTVHGPITNSLWEQHLAGSIGLGVVPILDDSSAVFGAIDVDIYPLDLAAVQEVINSTGLPLVLTRTKSGGAHLWVFLGEPVPAEFIRSQLTEWSKLFNHFKIKKEHIIEIFPKQDRLTPTSDGSWINMPYQSAANTTRYALGPDGTILTAEEFLAYAECCSISEEQLASFQVEVEEDDFENGPPCLQARARTGFGDWGNNGLFNIAVFLRKKHGDGWSGHLDRYRGVYTPDVTRDERNNTIKSVSKKEYFYTCKQEPICSVCDKKVCRTREFGVGGGKKPLGDEQGVEVGELIKIETDPPSYTIQVDGIMVHLDADDLLDQRRFRKLIFMRLNLLIPMIKGETWEELVRDRLERIDVSMVPGDATHEGQFWVHVQQFCTNSRIRGRALDEILLHKPFTEEGRTYFCSGDLFAHLTKNRFNSATEKDVFGWLRKRDVKHHTAVLKGQTTEYWSIPAFPEQTKEHDVPRAPMPERM